MLLIVAILLLIFLPWPWGLVGFLVAIPLWFLELYGWNRTVKNRRRVVGAQPLIGKDATVTEPCHPSGQVRVGGEIWEARCSAGANPGDKVRVTGRDELVLVVEPLAVQA